MTKLGETRQRIEGWNEAFRCLSCDNLFIAWADYPYKYSYCPKCKSPELRRTTAEYLITEKYVEKSKGFWIFKKTYHTWVSLKTEIVPTQYEKLQHKKHTIRKMENDPYGFT